MLWRWPETGGDQHLAEFVVVQPGGVLLVVQPGVQDVSGRRTVKQVFFYRIPAESGDPAQPAGDRRPGLAFGFQVTGEALDVSTTALEQADVALAAPGGVLPQDQRAGVADQARVAGQEPGGCANSNAAASSPATTPSRTLPPSAWDRSPRADHPGTRRRLHRRLLRSGRGPTAPDPERRTPLRRPPTTRCGSPRGTSTVSRYCGT